MEIGEKKRARVNWKKADGSPGRIQGLAVWTNSNPDAYQMDLAEDATNALFTKLKDGDTEITATGDADLGSGDLPITARGSLMDSGAVTGDFTFTDEV